MRKVLVTGAGGFLGGAVVKRLAQSGDYEITAAVSGRHPVEFPDGVHTEAADLLDERARGELMERVRPDTMLHLAWGLVGKDFWYSEENLRWLEASSHLCRLFREYGGLRFVFAGSHTEYGKGYPGRLEQEKPEDFTLYGACKLAFEQVASNFCRRNNIEFASGRFFSIYGPEDHRPVYSALTASIQDMLKGKIFECKGPWNIWDYIYVDDAAEAGVRLLESRFCGTLNIGSGQPQMMKNVFSMVAESIGRPELLKFDESSREYHVCSANVERMEEVLGYRCPTSFREGLEKTIQWWRYKLAAEEKKM